MLEKLRRAVRERLQVVPTGVRACFISCGIEEDRTVDVLILKGDATYSFTEATAGGTVEFENTTRALPADTRCEWLLSSAKGPRKEDHTDLYVAWAV
jgi:hypothetical protein